jgi:hypothetical protein
MASKQDLVKGVNEHGNHYTFYPNGAISYRNKDKDGKTVSSYYRPAGKVEGYYKSAKKVSSKGVNSHGNTYTSYTDGGFRYNNHDGKTNSTFFSPRGEGEGFYKEAKGGKAFYQRKDGSRKYKQGK